MIAILLLLFLQVVFGLPLLLFPSGAQVVAMLHSLFWSCLSKMSIFNNLCCLTSLLKTNDLLFSSSSSVLTLLICMMAMLLPVIPLTTCIVLPLLYSVHTFQFLIFVMFLGSTSGLFSWVVSCWLLHPLIKGSLLLTIVRTGHSVPLIKGIFSASGFCNSVLREKVISPQPNSKPGGPN